MTFGQVVMWGVLLLGVVNLIAGLRKWRSGGKPELFLGVLLISQAASFLGPGWVRYAAWAVMVPMLAPATKRIFTERDVVSLWIVLPFLLMILTVAATEAIFDDINTWQRVAMASIALGAAAAIAATVVRLVQARRTRRALG